MARLGLAGWLSRILGGGPVTFARSFIHVPTCMDGIIMRGSCCTYLILIDLAGWVLGCKMLSQYFSQSLPPLSHLTPL